MTYVLSKPGAVSYWIALSDALLKYVEDKNDPAIIDACKRLADLRIKVRVLTRLQAIELWDLLEHADTAQSKVEADKKAIAAGLVAMEGTDRDGEDIDDCMIEMIMASGFGPQVAMVIRSWQIVEEDQRAGFFTQAPEDLHGSATNAAQSESESLAVTKKPKQHTTATRRTQRNAAHT